MAGGGRSSAISRRISANSVLGTATSAIWNVTYRTWETCIGTTMIGYPLIGANFVSGSLTAIILYVKIFGAR